MQGADREYGQPPEMFLPESMRIFYLADVYLSAP